MYVNDLDGAKPVVFKPIVNMCPNDCGGDMYDEIEYAPFCPSCDAEYHNLSHDAYCRFCGTKLYWNVKWPDFLS